MRNCALCASSSAGPESQARRNGFEHSRDSKIFVTFEPFMVQTSNLQSLYVPAGLHQIHQEGITTDGSYDSYLPLLEGIDFRSIYYSPVFGFSFLAKLAQFIITPSQTFQLSVAVLCMLAN